MKSILIIEDNEDIRELERDYLEAEGFAVDLAADGRQGLRAALAEEPFAGALHAPYALIVLDLMLPGLDGFSICREIRARSEVPILMATAKREDIDKIRGLGLGADDYLVKPFSPYEFVARVKARIARYTRICAAAQQRDGAARAGDEAAPPPLVRGDLVIDTARRRVTERGREIALTNLEFALLAFLAQHPGIVFSRERLFTSVWGLDAVGDNATVMVHIGHIREKLEPDPAQPIYIETVRGAGYRFAEQARRG
ncbi:response regulator transcription factor [Selenomonas bovis]|uniref:Response regulator transcription factor n=1 Tax=Selenomonas bovis TaxID=416586 RepID=A0A848B4G5_9FIRM|nr:response regulator transcription factor [Selenomonas bovis]NMD99050.1 response regulator transcription factor [Selenomonas bovis]